MYDETIRSHQKLQDAQEILLLRPDSMERSHTTRYSNMVYREALLPLIGLFDYVDGDQGGAGTSARHTG